MTFTEKKQATSRSIDRTRPLDLYELDNHVTPADLREKGFVSDHVLVGGQENVELAILQCVAHCLSHLRIAFENDR